LKREQENAGLEAGPARCRFPATVIEFAPSAESPTDE
jgi:hypothetical protein